MMHTMRHAVQRRCAQPAVDRLPPSQKNTHRHFTPHHTLAYITTPPRDTPLPYLQTPHPTVKNQHNPQRVAPVLLPFQVLPPSLARRRGLKVTTFPQHAFAEQFLRPFAQWAAQPRIDGNAETALWPVDQGAWDMAVEHLPCPQPLALSVATLLLARQAPGKLGDSMIEQRHTRFEAHTHAGAIDLGEYVVGQIAEQVRIHHEVQEVRQRGPLRGIVRHGACLATVDHHLLGWRQCENISVYSSSARGSLRMSASSSIQPAGWTGSEPVGKRSMNCPNGRRKAAGTRCSCR